MSSSKPNHLIHETSPYLLQHAYNPVDWYPWGDEAFAKANHENKPILLSIGYAACHWCHVMAHESFENNDIAELMNRLFINIKVDREERPDLDKIYQSTHYLLTQRGGGWPLTVFLTPEDQTPFFSGTYFPPQAKYQLPAFKDVLIGIANLYQQRHDDIRQQNAELKRILNPLPPHIADVRLNDQPITHALQSLQRSFDSTQGGFGGAPKFPQAPRLDFLLAFNPVLTHTTLLHMAAGGIYDQLEGGFYRYAVDAEWKIPHFEKMLYDNGQLLSLYAHDYQLSQEPRFAIILQETADWVTQRMQAPEGGYYSSIDADSEGHEGKYYVWNKDEIKHLLTPVEFNWIEHYFGLNLPPNFENQWHFNVAQSLEMLAKELQISSDEAREILKNAKHKLLIKRNARIPPHQDKKILTAWNALMIKGMLDAGSALNEQHYIDSAQQALSFIRQHLWTGNKLLATYKTEQAPIYGYLDDYAFLIDALITALQIAWNNEQLAFAIELTESLLTYFYDQQTGGFYFTANDHEELLYRPKSMMDEALPSGNGIAARALLVLGHLLGETRYLDAAEKTLHAGWPLLTQYPSEHCSLLAALNDYLFPPQMIVLRGKATELKLWQNACKHTSSLVFAIPDHITNLPGLLATQSAHNQTSAYVCQGTQCLEVIHDLNTLLAVCSRNK